MRTFLLLSGLLAASPLTAQDAPPPAPDAVAPEKEPEFFDLGTEVPASLTLTDLDGKTVSFKELRGKVVVITWYAIYCPGIKASLERLKAMAEEYNAGKEVVMIAIDSDHGELADALPTGLDEDGKPKLPYHRIRQYLAEKKVPMRMFVDQGNVIADRFRAKTTPHMFVLDAKGVVRYSGALDNDMSLRLEEKDYIPYVRQAVQALLKGEAPPVTSTRPYG